MSLEDLFIRYYRVERIGDRMVAFEDPNGKYRAKNAELVEMALTEKIPPTRVEVLIGKRWFPIKRTRQYRSRDRRRKY